MTHKQKSKILSEWHRIMTSDAYTAKAKFIMLVNLHEEYVELKGWELA
tara:strand:- start:15 stop:158 length:144 start_codon:yes stop_codon:yes gene_type:complete